MACYRANFTFILPFYCLTVLENNMVCPTFSCVNSLNNGIRINTTVGICFLENSQYFKVMQRKLYKQCRDFCDTNMLFQMFVCSCFAVPSGRAV